MSSLSGPVPALSSPDPAGGTGQSGREVSRQYARRVLLPGGLAILLVPSFGPLSVLLEQLVRSVLAYELAKDVVNWLMLVELVAGAVLYVLAFVATVRLGRLHRADREAHAHNGARGWHAGSIVLLVLLALVPVALVLMVLALAAAFSMLNAGL
jgi:hypothetical protein